MNEILRKLKLKYTLTTTVLLGIFLLLLLGIFFVLHFAMTEVAANRTLGLALSEPDLNGENLRGRRCITFIAVDGEPKCAEEDFVIYYGGDMDILYEAMRTEDGNFEVNDLYFRVMSKTEKDGTMVYAVYDRTADREQLITSSFILAGLYAVSMILISVISHVVSSQTLRPVEESFKKQRDLITNASHELKTPLTIISTNLSVIKSEPNSTVESNEKWIESITAQIDRMNGLIQSMLELSKMEHEFDLKKEPVDLSKEVSGACLAFEAVCFEKGVTLITEIQDDVWMTGDKTALERLAIILLDNAIKYSGENGKIGCVLKADKKITLTVLNTGAVISEEESKHVFDRFYRADGARSNSDNKSFGLGLSIAHATVTAHGGTISCKGVPDKGTLFEVCFPVMKKTPALKAADN